MDYYDKTPKPTPEPSGNYPGIINYKSAKKISELMEKCICKIKRDFESCTGFFCKIPFPDNSNKLPVLITSNTIINQYFFQKEEKIVIFINNNEKNIFIDFKDSISRKKYTSEKYGTSIIEIKEKDNINNFLELEDSMVNNIIFEKKENFAYEYEGRTIYLMQYPEGQLSISFGILDDIKEDKIYNFSHKCSTSPGSSGSPIVCLNNKVIGIHQGIFIKNNLSRNNFGTFLNFPVSEFIKLNYDRKEKDNIIKFNFDNNIDNEKENLLEEFKKKYSLNIKNSYIDKLDLSKKNINNDGLIEFAKIKFIKLQELNLSNNNISDIDILQKAEFYNLKKLDFSHNKISYIYIYEKINTKELKYLNFFDNEISDIKNILGKIHCEKLEYLNLGANKISDISHLNEANFKELKVLNLQINNISDIKVFYDLKFKTLRKLNLCGNNLNEEKENKENNNKIILNLRNSNVEVNVDVMDDSHNPSMNLGIIFDVPNDILSQLIRFDNEKNFFENFLNQFKGEIITLINGLINGNEDDSYYDVFALIIFAIDYLNDENIIKERKKRANFIELFAKNIFDEECINKIFERVNRNNDLYKLINSEMVYNKFIELKNLLSQYYKQYLPDFFQHFETLISKPSSLNLSLKKIFEAFENNYAENKYIIIISDGKNSEQNSENINDLINEAKNKNITIVTLYLTKNTETNKIIFNEFPNGIYFEWLKYLFNISSKVKYNNPVARYYIKKGYDFPRDGVGTLFFETNLKEINSFDLDLKQITYEGIDIRIQDLQYENLIKFKYQFFTKNQIFGTCWANAYSAGIFLTNKRILGKKTESFETLRENIIKNACQENKDGGSVNLKVKAFFKKQNLHVEGRTQEEAINAFMKGRFIIVAFWLRDNQWNNTFGPFYQNNKTGILTEEELNRGLQNDTSVIGGHAVLLIEITKDYFRLLNSWGSNWADGGTFKVKSIDILKPVNNNNKGGPLFYDIFFYESELENEERIFYTKNNEYIRNLMNIYGQLSIEKIRENINELNKYFNYFPFTCQSCNENIVMTKEKKVIKDGLYYIKCGNRNCNYLNLVDLVDNKIKVLFIFENLLNDGNEDFDINFKEDYYINIDRSKIHYEFNQKIQLINRSDECSIGSENPIEKKIDSFSNREINSIICFDKDKFFISSANSILLFEIKNNKIQYLISKKIENENLLTLCNLKISNLIAIGGNKLYVYQINVKRNEFFEKHLEFNLNKQINKIILLDGLDQVIVKRFAVCDQFGFINIYKIEKERNNDNSYTYNFSSIFNKKYHQHSINCILYVPNENILLSGSNEDKDIIFWDIENNGLILKKRIDISFKIYNESFLNINNFILIADKDSINVYIIYKYIFDNRLNKKIEHSFSYKNEEFGIIYSIKSLPFITREQRNSSECYYFICGRSYGYCSIFLLRKKGKSIRKVNIFRNNNLMSSERTYNFLEDEFYIKNICFEEIDDEEDSRNSTNIRHLLVSSVDKTLKIYDLSFVKNVHVS